MKELKFFLGPNVLDCFRKGIHLVDVDKWLKVIIYELIGVYWKIVIALKIFPPFPIWPNKGCFGGEEMLFGRKENELCSHVCK